MVSGGEQAIEWIMVVFLAGIIGGALIFTMWSFVDATSYACAGSDPAVLNMTCIEGNTSAWITTMDTVLDLIPTWIKIIMIMGFTTVIALLGLTIYSVLKSRSQQNL